MLFGIHYPQSVRIKSIFSELLNPELPSASAHHRQRRTSCALTIEQAGKQRGVVILPGLGNAAGDYTA